LPFAEDFFLGEQMSLNSIEKSQKKKNNNNNNNIFYFLFLKREDTTKKTIKQIQTY
jgi:hypothetical protein